MIILLILLVTCPSLGARIFYSMLKKKKVGELFLEHDACARIDSRKTETVTVP